MIGTVEIHDRKTGEGGTADLLDHWEAMTLPSLRTIREQNLRDYPATHHRSPVDRYVVRWHARDTVTIIPYTARFRIITLFGDSADEEI